VNVLVGITIDPLVPTSTYLPTSIVVNVYDVVLEPTAGIFKNPIDDDVFGKVIVVPPAIPGACNVTVPLVSPAITRELIE
jgi:hypothetical protein